MKLNKKIIYLLCIASAFFAVSCRKHDYKSVLVKVPEMRNNHCVALIQDAFKRHPGIVTMEFKVEDRG